MQQTLAAGRQQAQEVYAQASENTSALAEERQRREALAQQRAIAEQRLEEVTSELVDQVSRGDALEAEIESLRMELEKEKQTNEFHQKSFQERCALALDEQERLKADLARTSKKEGEYRRQAQEARKNYDEAAEQLHAARRDVEAGKQTAEQLLQTTEALDRKLMEISQLHGEKEAQLRDRQSKLDELQIEADRLKSSEEATRRHAERTEARLKEELSSTKREKDLEIFNLRTSQQTSADDFRRKLRSVEQTASEAQAKIELFERQREWEAAALERQSAAHKDEHERILSDYTDAQQARSRLEQQVKELQQQLTRLRSNMDATSSETREQLARAVAEQNALQSQLQAAEQRLSQAQQDSQAATSRAATAEEGLNKLQVELQEERLKANSQVEATKRQAEAECRRLTKQVKTIQDRAQQEEQRAAQLLRAQEALRLQWQSELGIERDELEAKVEKQKREIEALRDKVRRTLALGPELAVRLSP